MSEYALFDIVIPSLNMEMASETVASLRENSTYPHNYIIIHNSDSPTGYIEPCNRGWRAGSAGWVGFVNDDVRVKSNWDEACWEIAEEGTYCFSPWIPAEDNMRLNGWFLFQKREYIEAYGWAFDPRFICWCGDIDLIKRLEEDHIEPVFVKGIEIEHGYSKTFENPLWQELFIPWQRTDLILYTQKWGTDANADKVKQNV